MKSETLQDKTETTQAPLTEEARDTVHEVVDKVALSTAELEKKARQGAQHTEQKVAEIANNTQQTGQAYLDKATQYTLENPLKALGIALASGYLISKLVSSKGV